MAIRTVKQESLDSIANAIRAQSGKTAKIAYPTGFISEINALQPDNRPTYSISGSGVNYALTLDPYSGDGINDWLLIIFSNGTPSAANDFQRPFTINFTKLKSNVDIFVVGGGGSGGITAGASDKYTGGGGGGGGYVNTIKNKTLTTGTTYNCNIGLGGVVIDSTCYNGGNTSFSTLVSANGGSCGNGAGGGNGGSGGGGGGYSRGSVGGSYVAGFDGGNGGSNGASGTTAQGSGGTGAGISQYAFGDSKYPLFGAGGGGSCGISSGNPGIYGLSGKGVSGPALWSIGNTRISPDGWGPSRNNDNLINHYGGGGWGGAPIRSTTAGRGGNGVILIRNARG